jgi:quercetin dioxygenase-like cupin family protein
MVPWSPAASANSRKDAKPMPDGSYPHAAAVHVAAVMPALHLTEDAKGVSHFADAVVPVDPGAFAPPAPPMPISAAKPCAALLLLVLPAGWGGAKHPSPLRQVGFCLSGRLRVEAGDGEVREFGAGAIWRMEDVSGSGHTTTVLGDEDVRLAIAWLPAQPGDRTGEPHA